MKDLPKIAIYTEDLPVKEEVYASGMNKVNNRLFKALYKHTTIIFSGSQFQISNHEFVDNEIKNKLYFHSINLGYPNVIKKIISKIYNSSLVFSIKLILIKFKVRSTNTSWIFCPCGVDPKGLKRAVTISKFCKIPLAMYLVDDFLSGAILANNEKNLKIAEHDVFRLLNCVSKIFVISEGLKRRVKQLYNLDSVVLPLPYQLPQNKLSNYNGEDNRYQIMFVGSISHFYIDGLVEMAEVIEKINMENKFNIKFRFTQKRVSSVKRLVGDFKCIESIPCETSEELYKELSNSLICFVPYSFDLKYKEMVSTSFPSKTLDYLSASKNILVYAPKYSTSVEYFKKYNLDTILDVKNKSKLYDVVLGQIKKRCDYSNKYRDIVSKVHSLDNIKNILIKELK